MEDAGDSSRKTKGRSKSEGGREGTGRAWLRL